MNNNICFLDAEGSCESVSASVGLGHSCHWEWLPDYWVGIQVADYWVGVRVADNWVGVRVADYWVGVRVADYWVGVQFAS